MISKSMRVAVFAIFFAVIALFVLLAQPGFFRTITTAPIIPESAELSLLKVEYLGPLDVFESQILTDYVDAEEIFDILRRYYSINDHPNPFSHWLGDVIWEIHVHVARNRPIHIVLGRYSFHYTDASETWLYRIIDAESLIEEIEAVLAIHLH